MSCRAEATFLSRSRNGKAPASFYGQAPAARGVRQASHGPMSTVTEETTMRSILLYLIGIPLPIILLLAMCSHHF